MTLSSALLTSLVYFALAVGAHFIICRLSGEKKFMLKGLAAGLVFFAAACANEWRTGRFDPVLLYLLATLWLTYLIFLINLLNSVTLKMLERLAGAPAVAMREEDFRGIFSGENGIKARLADMKINGFILDDGKSLRLTPKAGLLLKTVFTIRRVFSIDVTG